MPALYAYYDFVENWPELVVAINELEQRMRFEKRPVAADLLLAAFGRLRDELYELSARMATFGTETLRRVERETRVRPDTEGSGGPRLGDALLAEPVQQNLLPGSVGVANEERLDQDVPWWLTNEIGSTAHVGRHIYGFFFSGDDEAPPDESESRVHPLFQPGYSPVSGGGIIRNPIPARRFIAKAVPIIDREWKAGFAAAKGRFDVQMARAIATPR